MAKNSRKTLDLRRNKRTVIRDTIDKSIIPKYIDRLCKDCKLLKPCKWQSSFTIDRIPEYRTVCDPCHRAREKIWRQDTRENRSKASLNKNRTRKSKCIAYLGGKCSKCGYSKSNRALTFHHVNRTSKSYTISQIKDYAWDILKAELDKCVLLCMNCHMEMEDTYQEDIDAIHRNTEA